MATAAALRSSDVRPDSDDGGAPPAAGAFVVDLDGFEGPLDLLLQLARAGRLDLRALSIEALADQYLGYIAEVRRANLDLAAEYLVMAAWLADLKSRLLLPTPPDDDEPTAEALADALARQLRRLDLLRRLGARLMARPQRGIDVFPRGCPEVLSEAIRHDWGSATLHDLMGGYARHLRRSRGTPPLTLPAFDLHTVEAAIGRLEGQLAAAAGWHSLASYLPDGTLDGLRRGELKARSGLASTLVAGLELARRRMLALRQVRPFGPIAVCPLNASGELDDPVLCDDALDEGRSGG